jgi:nucleoside 2-deoxyribosyltransferase
MKSVYAAGPITGLSFTGATDWRNTLQVLLKDKVQVLSPLRSKDYLKDEKVIGDSYEQEKIDSPLTHVLSSSRGITTRDRNDVMNSDIILVNLLGATKVSIGTVMEIAWADMLRKPVVLIMEKNGNVHDHAMIRECVGFRVETLEQAAKVVEAVCAV